ncbi:unnamed protein product [Phytomonas sp. EM1]|nr:unnamed protein product [Phytomonas sp. EM1]|eukprot:CCW63351.1 unnamed protein product [Phytomonas sp. isolate EM1]
MIDTADNHVILDEGGEFFDEDPTVGRGVPSDPAGYIAWKPLQPAPLTPTILNAVKSSVSEAATN